MLASPHYSIEGRIESDRIFLKVISELISELRDFENRHPGIDMVTLTKDISELYVCVSCDPDLDMEAAVTCAKQHYEHEIELLEDENGGFLKCCSTPSLRTELETQAQIIREYHEWLEEDLD